MSNLTERQKQLLYEQLRGHIQHSGTLTEDFIIMLFTDEVLIEYLDFLMQQTGLSEAEIFNE